MSGKQKSEKDNCVQKVPFCLYLDCLLRCWPLFRGHHSTESILVCLLSHYKEVKVRIIGLCNTELAHQRVH